MKNQKVMKIGRSVLFGTLFIVIGNVANADIGEPMTPDVAAKAERSKHQQAERITPAKRKAAAQALKAQRQKLHDARKSAPQTIQGSVGITQEPHQNTKGE